jgi:hypothetical protein
MKCPQRMQDGFNHQTGQTTSTGTSLLVASGDARDRKTGRAICIQRSFLSDIKAASNIQLPSTHHICSKAGKEIISQIVRVKTTNIFAFGLVIFFRSAGSRYLVQ